MAQAVCRRTDGVHAACRRSLLLYNRRTPLTEIWATCGLSSPCEGHAACYPPASTAAGASPPATANSALHRAGAGGHRDWRPLRRCHRMWRRTLQRQQQDRAPTTSAWHEPTEVEVVVESVTITDNRNGQSIEIPIVDGGVAADEWSKLLPGIWFYDPAFMTTAAAESSITFVDGDNGDPRVPRLPDRAADKAVDLPRGRLSPAQRRAADRGPRLDNWVRGDHLPHLHPREHAQEVPRRFPLRRPPDGHPRLGHRRPFDLLPGREGHLRPRSPPQADHPADREDADARRGRPPLQRRHAVRLPRQLTRFPVQLPVDDVEDAGAAL